ncbi:xylulokinase [Microbacterium pseudoresistens]|uniref:Xylulokinase n=1 Tax=Microbacterium pseudoresistens TaxID=640634 RepID=A0A7Y9ET72_9MICO|nr:FGGY family carbohydrate kinase [Microbacterium pseudoresistens]NYD53314.1 xylulokinase [Microbacterium pseudoresistens]
MLVYAVDLGSTNLKVVLFDERARQLAAASATMQYSRDGAFVEFDADSVLGSVLDLVRSCASEAGAASDAQSCIVLTGQAESLVLADARGIAIAPAISWMDERSTAEAAEIGARFDTTEAFAVTGETEAVPTWPATKLRWLRTHRPDILAAAHHVLMVKDYILLRLTGRAVGEETTRGFTYLYDVRGRRYWPEMLDFCGVDPRTLPQTVPAGTIVGPVLAEFADRLPPAASYTVNAGALDHFCAMLGTSSYGTGEVSASAGTVLAVSLLATDRTFDRASGMSFHAGLRPGETVLFSCADSGGVALDWFRDAVAGGLPYDRLERELNERDHGRAPLFLPYLTGLNPPDFNPRARGAFVDLQLRHDGVDMAYAVMEGLAHLLRRNIDAIRATGEQVHQIVSTGGGTASRFWNQLKADVCGVDLCVPDEKEAACRGAAILALVAAGELSSIDDTARLHMPDVQVYRPRTSPTSRARYDRFDDVLTRLYGAQHPQAQPEGGGR